MGEANDVGPFDFGAWLRSVRVRAMTPEARGCYIDLLAYGWVHGGIPAKPAALRNLLGLSTGRHRRVWEQLGPLWSTKPGDEGRLVNERQEEERELLRKRSVRMQKVRRGGDVEVTYGPT